MPSPNITLLSTSITLPSASITAPITGIAISASISECSSVSQCFTSGSCCVYECFVIFNNVLQCLVSCAMFSIGACTISNHRIGYCLSPLGLAIIPQKWSHAKLYPECRQRNSVPGRQFLKWSDYVNTLWHQPCHITAMLLWTCMRITLFIRWLSVSNVTCSNLITFRVGNSNWTVNYVADITGSHCRLQWRHSHSDAIVALMSCCNESVKFYEKLHYSLDNWMVTMLLALNLLILEQAILF